MMNKNTISRHSSEETTHEPTEETSVDLVYSVALNSYDWAQKKSDSLDRRIQTLLVFAAGVLLVVPAQVHATLDSASYSSFLFMFALASFSIGCAIGVTAQMKVKIGQLDPGILYEHFIDLPPDAFRREIVRRSGSHLKENRAYLASKKDLVMYMLSLFGLGVGLLILWILASLR